MRQERHGARSQGSTETGLLGGGEESGEAENWGKVLCLIWREVQQNQVLRSWGWLEALDFLLWQAGPGCEHLGDGNGRAQGGRGAESVYVTGKGP